MSATTKRHKQRKAGKRQTPFPHEHAFMVGYPGRNVNDPDNDNDNDSGDNDNDAQARSAP